MAPSQAADDPKGTNTVSEVVVIANRLPTVEELTVIPRAECLAAKSELRSAPPKIVSTYPQEGELVRPGLLILRVTFDKPMTCSGFYGVSLGRRNPCYASQQHFLKTISEQDFLMSFDHKTVRVACMVEPNTHYILQLNGLVSTPEGTALPPQFVSLEGLPLDASRIGILRLRRRSGRHDPRRAVRRSRDCARRRLSPGAKGAGGSRTSVIWAQPIARPCTHGRRAV